MDVVSAATRSRMMAGIRSRNTKPEIAVRRHLFAAGFRFRLHRRDLPGAPDIVLPRYRLAVFVHGCFWHSHAGCPLSKMPASNREFWEKKLEQNRHRDERNIEQLLKLGWRVLVIWECSTRIPAFSATLAQDIAAAVLTSAQVAEMPPQPLRPLPSVPAAVQRVVRAGRGPA